MSRIVGLKSELKAVVSALKLQSPISEKTSCGVREKEELDEIKNYLFPEIDCQRE